MSPLFLFGRDNATSRMLAERAILELEPEALLVSRRTGIAAFAEDLAKHHNILVRRYPYDLRRHGAHAVGVAIDQMVANEPRITAVLLSPRATDQATASHLLRRGVPVIEGRLAKDRKVSWVLVEP